MSQSRRSVSWALLILVALLTTGIISLVVLQGRPPSQRIPPVAQGVPAKDAYALVKAWAPTWLPDAVIVNCTTTHRHRQAEDEGWTFQVYSPSRQVLAAVRAQAQEVSVLHETAALASQSELPVVAWRLDSPEALEVWWSNGGSSAWEQPDTDSLHLKLGLNSDKELTWQITVGWAQSPRLGFWEIAADGGQVLVSDVGGEGEN